MYDTNDKLNISISFTPTYPLKFNIDYFLMHLTCNITIMISDQYNKDMQICLVLFIED